MKQIWNIFRKDCRQFWPEVLATLFLTAAYMLTYAADHVREQQASGGLVQRLSAIDPYRLSQISGLAMFLLPVSWFLLAGRVVQAENLVGTRQFWLSRPYRWPLLLAEKCMFLLISIGVPFLMAQVWMVHAQGLPLGFFLPGLLVHLAVCTAVFVLPTFALAVVVSNLAKMVGTVLTVLAGAILYTFMARGSYTGLPTISLPWSEIDWLPLLAILCGVAVLLQYAIRRTWIARTLLIAVSVAVLVASSLPLDERLLRALYRSTPPPNFHLDAGTENSPLDLERSWQEAGYMVKLPVTLNGLAPDEIMDVDDIRLVISAPDGDRYQAPWGGMYQSHMLPGTREVPLSAYLDRKFADRHIDQTLTITIELALTILSPEQATTLILPASAQPFTLPGVGVCRTNETVYDLSCYTPFDKPHLTLLAGQSGSNQCEMPGAPTYVWTGDLNDQRYGLGLIPTSKVYPRGDLLDFDAKRNSVDQRWCAGTMVTSTPYKVARRFRYITGLIKESLTEFKPEASNR